MAREARTEVQKPEKTSVPTIPEQTRPGPVYSPSVDIFENDNSITVFADMPGVKAADRRPVRSADDATRLLDGGRAGGHLVRVHGRSGIRFVMVGREELR